MVWENSNATKTNMLINDLILRADEIPRKLPRQQYGGWKLDVQFPIRFFKTGIEECRVSLAELSTCPILYFRCFFNTNEYSGVSFL